MFIKKIKSLFHPERYHGWGKTKRYFEGWYYKIIAADGKNAFAFIPGIAMDENGNQQAFIQVLDCVKKKAEYIKFPAAAFNSSANKFKTSIDKNTFTLHKIDLNLPQIQGTLNFIDTTPWPSSWYSPGIMGPFSFVPFMQCYHGILSMNHTINGTLIIDGKSIDFTGGKGYTEKDWGHSFPSAYFWMHANHFSQDIAIKASVAKIPWLKRSFVGFIAGVYFQNKIIQFTTYNNTKLTRSFADKKHVLITMENKKYILNIEVEREEATALAAPILGFMDARIFESMNSTLHLKLIDKKTNTVIIDDVSPHTAVEIAGKIEEIMT